MSMTAQQIVYLLFAFGVGACIGSFLNVCAFRLPRDISVVSPGSYCPECGEDIPPRYNLPIVGWLLLRGRAACCGARFSGRYAFVEALSGVMFAVLWWLDPPAVAVAHWVFYSLLMVGILTDFDFLIIPDEITIGGAATGVVVSALVPALHNTVLVGESLQRSVIGLVAGALVLRVIGAVGSKALGRDAMGLGDVKLMACIGAFLGWQGAAFSLILGSLLGSLGGMAVLVLQQRRFGAFTTIPFGPALSVAALSWLFGGDRLWAWFLRYQTLGG
jgi:leader peptidase (prepilin peptidase)/N-methyltransferase